MSQPIRVGFLLYPFVTQLDLTGPAQVFAFAEGFESYFVWKDKAPVMTDAGFAITPTHSFDDCLPLDVLLVPGGAGQAALMQDKTVIEWLASQGATAAWISSVCSGSLLLGAAGLLNGYQAASHWNYREHLPLFGATSNSARVVRDRNRITGGGVTAGIDLALTILSEVSGSNEAMEVQLLLEYAPEPPFACGRPEFATEQIVNGAKRRLVAQLEVAEKALQ